ncbi:MAG: glycosyltransferase family 2 protein [Acidobacteria bacterium]|nr:glycosyltransferase family 2 protein [Acidobacteriota bacterium]
MNTLAITNSSHPKIQEIKTPTNLPGEAINDLINTIQAAYLLLTFSGSQITLGARTLERLVQVAEDTGATLVYSDFRESNEQGEISDHPLIDYQLGSIRDNFDFGSVLLLSRNAALAALDKHGAVPGDLQWGGLYDLRLKLSIEGEILRIPEPLYTRSILDARRSGEKIFDYVDPRNRDYQIEMEQIATAHLKRIGAYLEPEFAAVPATTEIFPVHASVIIPVRNREKTIGDAVRSVLSQRTDFDFNVIVVDNHSTDGTTEVLENLATEDSRVIHLIPTRTDYGIGGCWNEGVYSARCGRYAVQLDSDDIYTNERTLAKMVEAFENGKYAMVIGSYTTVDFDLSELPPGLIDHKEWTRDNGRNNALRINGLGAPRAFDVSILRQIGLPNVSYGEDYALALRISREYEIGRVYESVYFARRWSGNSDSALPLPTMNRYDTYKDRIRTWEIQARQRKNAR